MTDAASTELNDMNDRFFEKTEAAFRGLFDAARARNELEFAFSLAPEFRGTQDDPLVWSTAADTVRAFSQYLPFITQGESSPLKMRVALAFYCHLSEASGYYEVPKNMLRVAGGARYVMWPFNDLVREHRHTGEAMAPNANRVLQDLAGHAASLNFIELAEVFRDAFDPDLRNGYAHADYVIWNDGIRLGKRNGGRPRIVPWPEFGRCFERGVNFFHYLHQITQEYVRSYDPPRTIRASLGEGLLQDSTISYKPDHGVFTISGVSGNH